MTEILVPVSERKCWCRTKPFFFLCALLFGYLGEYVMWHYMCNADLCRLVIFLLVTAWISSGAVRPAPGGNQSCHTGIVGSSPAVGSWRQSQLLFPQLLWNCGFLSLLKICLLLPAFQVVCFLLAEGSQNRAGLGQAVLQKGWTCTHSDETLSWKDGGKWNTILKGEDPKENSWMSGKSFKWKEILSKI